MRGEPHKIPRLAFFKVPCDVACPISFAGVLLKINYVKSKVLHAVFCSCNKAVQVAVHEYYSS